MGDFMKYARCLFVEFLGSLILGIGQNIFRRPYQLASGASYNFMIGLFVFPFWTWGCMAMWYRITGAHLNPVITVVSLLRRDKPERFGHILAFVYIFAQYLGHFCGVALTWWYTAEPWSLNVPSYGSTWYYSDGIGQETVASFIFVMIYLHQTSRVSMLSKETALQLLVIAGTYASMVAWSFFKSGGSINPAYGFAQNFWDEMKWAGADPFRFIWIYTVFPFVGAAFAYALHHLLVLPGNRNCEENEKVSKL